MVGLQDLARPSSARWGAAWKALGPPLPPGRHLLLGQDRGSDLLRCDCATRGTNNTGSLCLGRTQLLFQMRTFPGEDIPDSSSRTFQYPCADREAVLSPLGWGRAQEMFPQFRTQRTQRPAVCSQWPDKGQRQVVGCCPVSVSLEPGRHGVQRCDPQASVQDARYSLPSRPSRSQIRGKSFPQGKTPHKNVFKKSFP